MSTATLHNEKKKTLVPQLRFQEFGGEWENEKLLKHVYSISSGKIKPSDEGEFFVYGSTGIIGKSNTYTHEGDYILVARVGANAGQINRAKGKYAVTDNTLIVDLKDNISVSFCESFLTKFNLNKLIFGSGQPLITGGLLKSIDFVFPSLPEQQKIASFLSAVDEKIQQLTRKASLLEHYKKGVMQQLFSGKLRFKDENGKDYPDWEEKRLGNLTFKVGKKNKENIQYPIYSINNKEGFLPQSEQFDGLDSNDRGYDISLYKIVESETFAYNPARINVGSIGYSYNLKKVIVSSLYVCFKTIDTLEDLYLLAYLETHNFKKDILRFEEGGVRQYLFYENFSLIKIPLPSNKEQQKIANFLSSIDSKIEMVNQQLAQTQTFKKGLLQQMFV
jgi:type I restriction enzyme S subunit